jgi:hypothetical protein
MIKTFFSLIILPLLIAIAGFIIEYQCFGDGKSCLPKITSAPAISLLITTFCVSAFFISLYKLGQIVLNPKKYFREDYALEASVTMLWLLIIVSLPFITKLMPWQVFTIILQRLVGNTDRLTSSSPWSEYFVLILVSLLMGVFISNLTQSWQGKKSTQQYEQEQRSEAVGVFHEGIREFLRRWRREPELVEYIESDTNSLATPLEPVRDSIKSWEMKARELVRLSSTSYDFDEENWHDKQEVWVGKNIDTQKLVFLYPVQKQLNENDLREYDCYARNFATNQNQKIDEIIVAFDKEEDKEASPHNYKKIRFETENSLLDSLIKLVDYRRDIRKRVENHQLPQSNWTLKDVYVPSLFKVNDDNSSESKENLETYLRKWLNESSQRQIALLGEYGQGKSSAALMFTYNLLFQNSGSRIPIIIELRGTSPRNLSPLELLGAWASKYRIDSQALMRLHIAGRLLLIFEGFDEMALSGNREERIKHFKTLWQFCYPQAKIIITGRPNFFLDDKELKMALGVHQPIGDNPYCDVVQLLPFSVEQIRESLRNQTDNIQQQISILATNNERFYDVVSRPSLLHVVSFLWEKENLGEKIDLLNSAYVMGRFVQNSYRRQGLKSQDSREFMALNSSEREYFMEGIACFMAANELNNQIDGVQLNKLIKDLIDGIPDSVSSNVSVMPNEETKPLKQRIKNYTEDDYIEHIQTDVRTCGLLVSDLSSLGKFKFGHKSFMEYLVANVAAQIIKQDQDYLEKYKAIVKITNIELVSLIKLPVSIEFLSELLGTDTNRADIQPDIRLTNQRVIARNLFNKIFNIKHNQFKKVIIHYLFFSELYEQSLAKIKKSYSFRRGQKRLFVILAQSWSPINLPIILLLCTSPILLIYTLENYSFNIYINNNWIFTIIMSMSFFISISLNIPLLKERWKKSRSLNNEGITNQKISLWNKICKDIGIEDQVLHEIAGTKWLPWAKNQPFDYFLDNSDDSNS